MTGWWLLAGLAGTPAAWGQAGVAEFREAEWKAVFQGVEQARVVLTVPRALRAEVLRVRLDVPGVSLLATPGNGDAPGETSGLRTSHFLKAWGCQAAVNAAPFDKVSTQEGLSLDIKGWQVSGGVEVSQADRSPALVLRKDGRAEIRRPPFPQGEIQEAVAGFQVVLDGGRTVATDLKLHPRTGAGVSANGKTLWLLVVDGRQAGRSEGCTTPEMADWLRAMGADAGINLDGGGTSTMVLEGPGGGAVVVNRPIHAGIPGLERPSGSHLGVMALRLGTGDSPRGGPGKVVPGK